MDLTLMGDGTCSLDLCVTELTSIGVDPDRRQNIANYIGYISDTFRTYIFYFY